MATSGEPLFTGGENLNIRELSSDQNPHVFVLSWAQRKMTSRKWKPAPAVRELRASFRGRGIKTKVRGSVAEPESVSRHIPYLKRQFAEALRKWIVEAVAAEVGRKCTRKTNVSTME